VSLWRHSLLPSRLLAKKRGINDAFADVAACSGVDSKTLRNYRDGLNRGRGDPHERYAYVLFLDEFEEMSRAEILAAVKATFVTIPS